MLYTIIPSVVKWNWALSYAEAISQSAISLLSRLATMIYGNQALHSTQTFTQSGC